MELRYKTVLPLKHKTRALAIGCFEDKVSGDKIKCMDSLLNKTIQSYVKDKTFSGKKNQILHIPTQGNIPADHLIIVGLGKKRQFDIDVLRQAAGSIVSRALQLKVKEISIDLLEDAVSFFSSVQASQTITEGAILSSYRFTEYKTDDDKEKESVLEKLILISEKRMPKKEIEDGMEKGKKISCAVFFARDLVSRPGNSVTPTFFAEQAVSISKRYGIDCTVLGAKDIKKLKMEAFLSVAKGSYEEPKFIILKYAGTNKTNPPYILIGKGITFDSGGISLKPSKGMQEMKFDMAGGAAVLGAVMAIASLKLPVNLVSLIPATENMPGGSASKPGDVLKSMCGKTIEIISTDAEGRLIMADALTYAKQFKPKAVIDIATLTGACIVALGHGATAVLGNNDKLIAALKDAGDTCGEKVWQLPLWEDYKELIKSNIADLKNVGDGSGGVITAASFLGEFADDFTWAHLDIAGTAWEDKDKPYIPKGASGVGVRLFVQFFENILKNKQK